MLKSETVSKIFQVNSNKCFSDGAKEIFYFQYHHNTIYQQWCNSLNYDIENDFLIHQIPFLPISFFKTHFITTTAFSPEAIFESSGTTTTINSKHLVKDISIYEESFLKAFEEFYGNVKDWCIIGLLPSYLERNTSSLVFMVNKLITKSKHIYSGFYLHEFEKLAETLMVLEKMQQKTLLIGVTFALLDFAEKFSFPLQYTTIMETGGMKGRRAELTRNEVHEKLKKSFAIKQVHSEYGMTELLSQAYAKQNGKFICPNWMKVLVRDEDDPFVIKNAGKGVLNIIDLANIHSCSFIATDDVGIVYEDGTFEVLGRLDNGDIRGCSLMVV